MGQITIGVLHPGEMGSVVGGIAGPAARGSSGHPRAGARRAVPAPKQLA